MFCGELLDLSRFKRFTTAGWYSDLATWEGRRIAARLPDRHILAHLTRNSKAGLNAETRKQTDFFRE